MNDITQATEAIPRRKPARRRKRPAAASLPYENATTGKNAVAEMEKILRAFGASSFGCMEDFDRGDVIVQFSWRNHNVTIRASGKGWAAHWLKRHPWTYRMRTSRLDHEKRAVTQGRLATYSILRDWVKGQITAVETGILSFEGAFLGQIMLPHGETVLEHIAQQKLLAIAPPTH
jgi:hypothetical protein